MDIDEFAITQYKPLNDHVKRYTSVSAVRELLKTGKIYFVNPVRWSDRNDCYFMNLYKTGRKIRALYALCYSVMPETYHHWKVFTKPKKGVCIEFKRAELESVLRKKFGKDIRFRRVSYVKLPDARKLGPSNLRDLPFIKRVGYLNEGEYRMIVERTSIQRDFLKVSVGLDVINRIVLDPWLSEKAAKKINAELKLISGSGVRFSHTKLIDSVTWKKAGNGVLQRTHS